VNTNLGIFPMDTPPPTVVAVEILSRRCTVRLLSHHLQDLGYIISNHCLSIGDVELELLSVRKSLMRVIAGLILTACSLAIAE